MKHTVKKMLVASVASALVMGGTVAVAAGMDVPIIKATPVLKAWISRGGSTRGRHHVLY